MASTIWHHHPHDVQEEEEQEFYSSDSESEECQPHQHSHTRVTPGEDGEGPHPADSPLDFDDPNILRRARTIPVDPTFVGGVAQPQAPPAVSAAEAFRDADYGLEHTGTMQDELGRVYDMYQEPLQEPTTDARHAEDNSRVFASLMGETALELHARPDAEFATKQSIETTRYDGQMHADAAREAMVRTEGQAAAMRALHDETLNSHGDRAMDAIERPEDVIPAGYDAAGKTDMRPRNAYVPLQNDAVRAMGGRSNQSLTVRGVANRKVVGRAREELPVSERMPSTEFGGMTSNVYEQAPHQVVSRWDSVVPSRTTNAGAQVGAAQQQSARLNKVALKSIRLRENPLTNPHLMAAQHAQAPQQQALHGSQVHKLVEEMVAPYVDAAFRGATATQDAARGREARGTPARREDSQEIRYLKSAIAQTVAQAMPADVVQTATQPEIFAALRQAAADASGTRGAMAQPEVVPTAKNAEQVAKLRRFVGTMVNAALAQPEVKTFARRNDSAQTGERPDAPAAKVLSAIKRFVRGAPTFKNESDTLTDRKSIALASIKQAITRALGGGRTRERQRFAAGLSGHSRVIRGEANPERPSVAEVTAADSVRTDGRQALSVAQQPAVMSRAPPALLPEDTSFTRNFRIAASSSAGVADALSSRTALGVASHNQEVSVE